MNVHMLQSQRLEPTDPFGEYHCQKICGPYTYELAPTGWASSLKFRRTWTLFVTRQGGVKEQIGSADVAGATAFWRWWRHCPPEYRVKIPYSRSVDPRKEPDG